MKQVRIVGLGDYNGYFSYFTYGVMEGAIRCGVWFRPVSLLSQPLLNIKEQINFFKPHIILAHCIFNRKPHDRGEVFDLLSWCRKRLGAMIFYHMGDARSEPRYPQPINPIVDGVLINNGEGKKWSEKWWRVPCYHWPYPALYQKDIADFDKDFEADVVFTGGLSKNPNDPYHYRRTLFVEDLKKNYSVRTYPDPYWGNSRFLTAEVAASSKVLLGFQMGEDVYLYNDVRPFQYTGAGALYFHNKHSNMDYFFKDGLHYVGYESFKHFKELYEKYVVKDPVSGNSIRRNAFEFSQNYHSTERRVQFVIDIWKGKEPKMELSVERLLE